MAKIDNKIQWDTPTHLFKCYCGESSFLEIIHDDEDRQLYISITQHPTTLRERLTLAWKALCGYEFSASNEVVLDEEDINKLIKALKLPKKEQTK